MSDDNTPAPRPDENGLPLCTEEECPAYDGKRCILLGHRPQHFCEPALVVIVEAHGEVTRTLEALRAKAKELKAEVATLRVEVEALRK